MRSLIQGLSEARKPSARMKGALRKIATYGSRGGFEGEMNISPTILSALEGRGLIGPAPGLRTRITDAGMAAIK